MKDKHLEELSDLAYTLCWGFLINPERFQVNVTRDLEGYITVEAVCDPTDYGKLIGKKGQNYKAVEMILYRAGEQLQETVEFVVPAPDTRKIPEHLPFRRNKNWTHDAITKTVKDITLYLFSNPVQVEIWNGKLESKINVELDENEDVDEIGEIESALQKIVHAHAKTQGWDVSIKLTQ